MAPIPPTPQYGYPGFLADSFHFPILKWVFELTLDFPRYFCNDSALDARIASADLIDNSDDDRRRIECAK